MEKYHLSHHVKVFGRPVDTFPEGINEAFQSLMKMLPHDDERPYYGLSECVNGNIKCVAAALETFEGEAEAHHCERYLIPAGSYISVSLTDWRQKLQQIRGVFESIMKEDIVDRNSPAIEIYKNDREMLCMIKIDYAIHASRELDATLTKLTDLASSFTEQEMNDVPFEGSWTPGQLIRHLIISNSGLGRILNGAATETERAPDEMMETMKKDFLDFSWKVKAAERVQPGDKRFEKERLLESLGNIKKDLLQSAQNLDLTKTCSGVELPRYGTLTRYEVVFFIVYHTERHVHQLSNMKKAMKDTRLSGEVK